MTRWTDDRIDNELRDFLDRQAEETADAPSADEMALRIRTRNAGGIGSRWRLSPTTVVASLVVLLVVAFAATMTIGAWRPLFDGRGPEPLAVVVTSPTPSSSAQDEPVVSASPSSPLPSAIPSASSSAMPTETPVSSASAGPSDPPATPTPTPDPATPPPTPTEIPVLDPAVRLLVDGEAFEFGHNITSGQTVDVELTLVTRDLDRSACELTHATNPDAPGQESTNEPLSAAERQMVALTDGWHTFAVACESTAGVLKDKIRTLAMDREPERCKGVDFTDGALSAATIEELAEGIVGSWEGCVTTPWVPTYFVSVTFRANGTYSAESTEVLDDQEMIAMYYGIDEDSSAKRYAINDLQASGNGLGEIDIDFGLGSTSRGDLRNIKLMGDKLSFEFFHRGQYGPLLFELERT